MLDNYPDVLTPSQTAEILRIGLNSMYRMINKSEIGFKRIGTKIIVPKCCVTDYLQSARQSYKS